MRDTLKIYNDWLHFAHMDSELKSELIGCADNQGEIDERFYRDLEFGTGGLRGIIGAGTNRINIYTIAKATRGLATYLKREYSRPSCAIAYDSRNKSRVFAEVSASVLAGMGVRVHIFEDITPTPILSFAVRRLGCSSGIVITASHNPAAYNGYKVYNNEGCQIVTEAADEISKHINQENDLGQIADYTQFFGDKILPIGGDVLKDYYSDALKILSKAPQCDLSIVYSPLNGAGNKPVRELLSRLAYVKVTVVPEQENPDGDFPTCPYPNPEDPEAMRLALELMLREGADLCIATDPDSDRIGVGLLQGGETRLLNGNELGILLFEYICKRHKQNGTMPENPVAVKTIVTTEMADKIAEEYGVELRNVLTGFKFIGEQICILEAAQQENRYIFGFEESFGYLAGAYVRDKDAVSTSGLVCEMAAYYKAGGKTLLGALDDLYHRYGFFASDLLSFEFSGIDGMSKMEAVMDYYRYSCPHRIAGRSVINIADYMKDGSGLPSSNVLAILLEDGCNVVLRPSGTEPKLKFYLSSRDTSKAAVAKTIDALKSTFEEELSRHML